MMKTITRSITLGALIAAGCADNSRNDDEVGDAIDEGVTLEAGTSTGTTGDGDGDSWSAPTPTRT